MHAGHRPLTLLAVTAVGLLAFWNERRESEALLNLLLNACGRGGHGLPEGHSGVRDRTHPQGASLCRLM